MMTKNVHAFFCEKMDKCQWQGFALHQGLGWGEVPSPHDTWREYHDRECGGKLIQMSVEVEVKGENK